MKTTKVKVQIELRQDRTAQEERHGLIASLSELARCHDIIDAKNMGGNRVRLTFDEIGDWILYANTGTCFMPCDGVVAYGVSGRLRHEKIFHTARLAYKWAS